MVLANSLPEIGHLYEFFGVNHLRTTPAGGHFLQSYAFFPRSLADKPLQGNRGVQLMGMTEWVLVMDDGFPGYILLSLGDREAKRN